MNRVIFLGFVAWLGAAVGLVGCRREVPEASLVPAVATSAAPDRLQAQETLPGREKVFGLEVPSGMRVNSRFDDVVHLSGSRSVTDLVTYFSKHVSVAGVELLENGARFARARIHDDPKQRIVRIDISREGPRSRVTLSDVTPPPAIQGLSEAERWQRAGLNADGSIKDRLKQF
jgi:hypothetical protein